MSGWLLDANVLSELRRPRPNRKVVSFISEQTLDALFVSTVTFVEIRYGIERIDDPKKRSDIGLWLEHKMRPLFYNRMLTLSEDVLLRWRLIIEDGRRRGHTFSHPDVLIAATAAHHALTVVTRNVDELAAAGVGVMNPWVA